MNILRDIFKDKKMGSSLLMAVIIGIMLMITSSSLFEKKEEDNTVVQKEEEESYEDYERRLEKRLENILGKIEGVGKIEVMITIENSGEIIVDKDKSSEKEYDTKEKVMESSREEEKTILLNNYEPLIIKKKEPKVSGVLIICEGGGNAETKNSLINAVKALLNVEVHKIEVLKMK